MDNKEQARVKALEFTAGQVMDIVKEHAKSGGRDLVIPNTFKERKHCFYAFGECFPFADLKDGDLCICSYNEFANPAYFYDGDFYETFNMSDGFRNFEDKYEESSLIKKTGFNILEHLEGK